MEMDKVLDWVELAVHDEWFAVYQYWVGSVLIADEYENVILQFVEHSGDEHDHATELAMWLIGNVSQDGKFPLPTTLLEVTGRYHCGGVKSLTSYPDSLITDNLGAERCAIEFYTGFLKKVSDRDLVKLLKRILVKEKEHECDLERLLQKL